MERSLTIPIAIALGGIIIAGAIYIGIPKSSSTGPGNPALVRPVSSRDHIVGNPAAPVMIVEYSDFECTFCKDFHETLLHIISNEGANGKVALVYREFPLAEIHPHALSHARAAECIAEVAGNDAFWKFANLLFKNQPVNPVKYGELASASGVFGNDFATCFASASTTIEARIMADRQNALDMGADGTPYSLILVAGKPPIVMNGGYSYDAVKQLVDEALQNVKDR